MRALTIIALLLTCLLWPPSPASAAQTGPLLRIGLIPEMNVFAQMERFSPLANYLSDKTGHAVEFTILSRYGNILTRFQNEQLDGAFLGSFTGALAIEQLGLIPLARPVNLNGESTYRGLIYTRKDSGITTVTEMRGKKFAFVEKATTAGYMFPLAYFRSHGVNDIESFFEEHYFAGSHDASLLAVLNGQADVGASKNTVYDWIRKAEPRIDAELVILAESAKVPSNGLCVRPTLDAALQSRLKTALLDLHLTPQGQKILAKLKAIKFIETSATDYQPVATMAAQAGFDLETYHYLNE